MFSAFPGGLPGAGLLILRVAAGLIAITQGILYLASAERWSLDIAALALTALASGVLLLIGFLTPLAAGLIGVGALAAIPGWLPVLSDRATTPNLVDSGVSAALAAAIAAAVGFLGPGAYSVDARLFGRREIIIPRSPR